MADGADGSVVISVDLDDKKAQAELNRLSRKIENLNAKIASETERRDALMMQAASIREQLAEAKANEQDERAQFLDKEYLKVYNAIERINLQMAEHNRELSVATQQAGEYAAQLSAEPVEEVGQKAEEAAESTDHLTVSLQGVGGGLAKIQRRLSGLAKRILFFSVFTMALRGLRTWLMNTVKGNEEAAAAFDRLKNAALRFAEPVMNVVIPALTTMANVLAEILNTIADGLGLEEEAQDLDEVGNSAKKAGGQLASFDTINKLSGSDDSSKKASGSGEETSTNMLDSMFDDLEDKVAKALLLGGIALVAIGAATTKLGVVVAGIGLLYSGFKYAEGTGVAGDWAKALGFDRVESMVTTALLLGGMALLVIGIIANLPLMVITGLGMLSAGAVYGSKSGTFDEWAQALGFDRVESMITTALLLGGMALIVIGIIAQQPLLTLTGIGMISAGVAYGVSSGTLANWAKALGLDDVFDYVVVALQLAGIALIALGAAKGIIPLVIVGIGFLVAGFVAESVGEEKLKQWWDTLQLTSVQQWVGVVLLLGGIALIAIGACTTNIAMILAGMAMVGVATITNAENGNLEDWVKVLGLEKAVKWVTAALLIGGMALIVIGLYKHSLKMVLAGMGFLGAGISIGLETGTIQEWLDTIGNAIMGAREWITAGLLIAGLALVIFGILFPTPQLVFAGLALLGAGIAVGIGTGTFSEWLDTIGDAFTAFKDVILNVWDQLWSGTKNAINGLLGFIENMANGVVDGINTVVDALNGLSFTIPQWVPGLGGSTFGFDIPKLARVSIPRLAEGAVIPPNREFLAVLGDQSRGTNIEAPLETIMEAVRAVNGQGNADVVRAIEAMKSAIVWEIKNKDTATYLDGQELAQGLYRPLQQVQRSVGRSMVTVG